MLVKHLDIILSHALQTGKHDGHGLGGVTAFPQSLLYLTMPILVRDGIFSVCLTCYIGINPNTSKPKGIAFNA